MKHKKVVAAALLIAVILVSFFAALYLISPAKQSPAASKPFYVGIETGWNATVAQCEAVIDQVKDYTNLYIIASPQVIKNESALNQVCDYAYTAGMYFMPEFYQEFFVNLNGYTPSEWFTAAKQRYGDHLLGVYYYDEDGGNQLDMTKILKNYPYITPSSPAKTYQDYADYFFWLWTHDGANGSVPVTSDFIQHYNSSMFTSDYGLYWFDYELGYNTVLAQFGWNNSRQLQVSLARGAAKAQNQTWGAIITWTYNGSENGGTYLEPPSQMYSDMVLAYNSGASCISIYDSSQNYVGTTLNSSYLVKMQNFWNYVHQNLGKHGSLQADTAVVLPQDYGFGFRSQTDSVWQNHTATSWTQKMYSDITNLLSQKGSELDIVYSDPQFQTAVKNAYGKILYWPQDFENGVSYPIMDLNNSLGYNTVQDAVSSFATYEGATVLVKAGTYQENVLVTKPVTLFSQDRNVTILKGTDVGAALSIVTDNVTITGFTVESGASVSPTANTGILLENAHNCTVDGNLVTDNYAGVQLVNSTENVFRNNIINGNTYGFVLQNSPQNSIDASNTVNGKPYTGTEDTG